MGINSFFRKSIAGSSIEKRKDNREILEERVDEYYKVFISKNDKSILTFLLNALYYLNNKKNNYNYNDLLKYLRNHRQELLENELYLKLLCLCYKQLDNNRFIDKDETIQLMNDNFKKIVITNLKIRVDFKALSEDEIISIIKKDSIIKDIDRLLEHLIK